MHILDMQGLELKEGDTVQLLLPGHSGPQQFEGVITHLYSNPAAVTLKLSNSVLVFDPLLRALVRREVGDSIYKVLYGVMTLDGDFYCYQNKDGYEYSACRTSR